MLDCIQVEVSDLGQYASLFLRRNRPGGVTGIDVPGCGSTRTP